MHSSDVWVDLGQFFSAFCVADQSTNLPFRVRRIECVQRIAAYEASSSCPVGVADENGVTSTWEWRSTYRNTFGIVAVMRDNGV